MSDAQRCIVMLSLAKVSFEELFEMIVGRGLCTRMKTEPMDVKWPQESPPWLVSFHMSCLPMNNHE